ncbi:glycoside hydrolase family 104 protein, partial [Escherichia coli]|nr:glycoside hydrolase family 104 protein [Escherichia coli]EJO8757043.1 lysozyme [Escherichia coli]HAX3315824.1 glycoside hydrolase family 104 protein [Escherichia coli]
MNKNVKAFLDALAWTEGTSTSRYTKNDGYDIIVDGIDSPHTFTDYSTHPAVLVTVNR